MTEADGRAAVVAVARTWLRTPWHHRAHVRGVGVDCAQFLIVSYAGAGLIEFFETGDYPRDWHIHRDVERMVPIVQRFCVEIPEARARPADIVVFKIARVFSHAAILVDAPQIIHSHLPSQMVTYGDLSRDSGLCDVPRRWFCFREWAHGG